MKPIKEIEFYCKSNMVTKGGSSVYEAFPVDSEREDKSTPESWATKRFPYGVDGEHKNPIPPVIFKYNNKFDNIRIVEIDRRGNGGRAYKVIIETPDNKSFYVDLREKTLLDTILNAGIRPNGYLNGEFAFVRDKSQTNLVRCDSEEYQEAVKMSKLKENQKPIATKDLVPMTLYQRGVGDKDYVLYIGECYIPTIDEVIGGETVNKNKGSLSPVEDVRVKKKAKKIRAFMEIYTLKNEKDISEIKQKTQDYNMKLIPTVKVFREVMKIDDQQFFTELFERVCRKEIKDLEWHCSLYPTSYSSWGSRTMYHLDADSYRKLLPFACVALTKEEAINNVEKYKNYNIKKGKYENDNG